MRKPTMRCLVLAIVGAVGVAAGFGACRSERAAPAPSPSAGVAAAAEVFFCPMHPDYRSQTPGSCPICGMTLVSTQAASGADSTSTVQGRAVLEIPAERRQTLGVRSELVRSGRLDRTIRTVGRVAVDERLLRHVHTKYDGYVEHLFVDYTGKLVRKGEPLLSIYSPDLVATQQEYLLAYRAQAQLAESGMPQVARGGADLLEAARQRLLFWDIRPVDIETLEKTGQVMRTLNLHAEIGGYVVAKQAFHGMRVTPMDTLYDIADLSHLWVLADVYEHDLPHVREGMQAEVTVPYLPDRSWRGPITNVAPTVEEKTRTVKVRVELDNRGQVLKPDMYADVFLRVSTGQGLIVPESAVIVAGDRRLVFLDRGEGRFEPREVTVGVKVENAYQVLSGLVEGDRVVVAANFLIDSESSLKAALATMSAGPHEH